MSAINNFIKSPLPQIREFLTQYSAELRETKFQNLCLIKFNPETKVEHPLINQLRGLLFNSVSGQIYSLTFPVPIEVKDMNQEAQKALVAELSPSHYTVQEALDGTLLRLSFLDDKVGWILSTNGKEDARDAFWMNGCSFYDQFWSAKPPINMDQLNKNYVYMFLLCHPFNVIVVNHPIPKVYHLATYDRTSLTEIPFEAARIAPELAGASQYGASGLELGIEHPSVLNLTIEEVQKNILESHDKPVHSAGYMVIKAPDSDGVIRRYRFENFNYTQARDLRGNSNNINYLLLELMLDHDPSKLGEFLEYYPIYKKANELLHTRLVGLIGKLYREYGARYKEHSMIFVHPRHHKFLGEIHGHLYLGQLKGQGKTVPISRHYGLCYTSTCS